MGVGGINAEAKRRAASEGGGENPEQALINAKELLAIHEKFVERMQASAEAAKADNKPVAEALTESVQEVSQAVEQHHEPGEDLDQPKDQQEKWSGKRSKQTHQSKLVRPKGGETIRGKESDLYIN